MRYQARNTALGNRGGTVRAAIWTFDPRFPAGGIKQKDKLARLGILGGKPLHYDIPDGHAALL